MPGGTLKTVMTQDFFHGLDPTAEYYSVSWEFLRCCMARTLLSYVGAPADQGGADLQPDLATEMPTVSSDGLTWDFTLRPGIMFGDPLNKPIVAGDFKNAFDRFGGPGGQHDGLSLLLHEHQGVHLPAAVRPEAGRPGCDRQGRHAPRVSS